MGEKGVVTVEMNVRGFVYYLVNESDIIVEKFETGMSDGAKRRVDRIWKKKEEESQSRLTLCQFSKEYHDRTGMAERLKIGDVFVNEMDVRDG